MRPGRYHKVTIQQPTTTKGSKGQDLDSWSAYKSWFAKMRPFSGRERFQAMQTGATVDYEFTGRWVSGVTAKMRILFGTRTFDISSVSNVDEKSAELQIFATEEV